MHNRLTDIRIGRKYARGDSMDGNKYECFTNSAEEVYGCSIAKTDDLKDVKKAYFIEGYDLQREELSHTITQNLKLS